MMDRNCEIILNPQNLKGNPAQLYMFAWLSFFLSFFADTDLTFFVSLMHLRSASSKVLAFGMCMYLPLEICATRGYS